MIVHLQDHIIAAVSAMHYYNDFTFSTMVAVPTGAPPPGQPFYLRDSYTLPSFIGNSQT